ncbi:RNA 2'-phosphotransferase [Halomicrococcus sp. NG-SE-24]|uniref:RNA 2'-phosphotransferase n=1 Tax=Halomicrococcus sp. NG-SE-24 TaxID=3436928 RepID=UPI003D955EB9
MTETVVRCPEHGYVAGDACPACDERCRRVLSADRRKRLSKFCSGALRHFPDDAGVELDDRGWTDDDALVAAVTERYDWATAEHVDAVVATDPKGRFERSGGRIRAAYGHSVDVTLDADAGLSGTSETDESAVPDELYHGTAPRNLDAIRDEGLRPMGRQEVHLSETREGARAVGRRHADDPAVLAVDAKGLVADGRRVTRRGEGVYATERVPPEYVDRVD